MKLRGCGSSHFIWSITDGEMKKVHNMDSLGRPSPKFKKLEEIYQNADTEFTSLPFVERETRERIDYVKENEPKPDFPSDENNIEELTLSQLKKKCKRKKRKASESVILIPKVEDDDDYDLTEPLCKFRVKVSKSSQSKTSSRTTQLVKSELNKDLATVNVKVEAPEVEYFESNHENKGENCEINKVSFDSLDDIKNMELDNEENRENVLLPLPVSEIEKEENVKASTSDCSQSQLYLQQTPQQVNYTSGVQDSESTIDDEHDKDVVHTEVKSPISANTDADSNPFNSDNNSSVPAKVDSEVKSDHNYQADVVSESSEIRNSHSIEIRQPERLPLTRKVISPNSQEKLCQAMKSAESLDDMEHYKCKEKLHFGEQAENKFSSTKSDIENNELNLHPQQATKFIQNKVVISPKHVLKRQKNYKKNSPTLKSCLDGPRLCRSLPRLSTGCTSIEGCSESAIAFAQRQMHDIESLASKLMSELNSMKVIVEEKMLYEAYRSSSLKNEADEVKSAIKGATKTEETAKKWLSMMARDCNRFCKIMKLNEDNNTSADPALGNTNQEKPLQRERKKISFADEAGGTLCDIKVYQIEQDSLELNEKPQSSLA